MRQKTSVSNSSATSRTPTPTSSRSSTPHSRSNRNKSILKQIDSFFVYISNDKTLYPVSIILSTITINMAPSLCATAGNKTSFKCHQCPNNSKCGALFFECLDNYTRVNNNCVTAEQFKIYNNTQNKISTLASKISQLLDKEDIYNLDDLSKKLGELPYQIRKAIEFTDFRINSKDETIEKVFTSPSVLGYWIFVLISSLFTSFGLIVIGYHFLRIK